MNKLLLIIVCLTLNLSLLSSVAVATNEVRAIAGTVVEKKSGEYAIGIAVALYSIDSNTTVPLRGAYTNKFGFYSLANVKAGKYRLVASGIGYESYSVNIDLSGKADTIINLELQTKDIRMEEVTVEGEQMRSSKVPISTIDISPFFITRMPSLVEVDVFRSLQLLPGVQQATELSSGLYIRGGSPDQNLTLLDGVIVYNPSHLGGFLSTFNSDCLRDIRLIKGAFPAEYGGRLSSVLDMTMKEGTKEKISGTGGISLISSRLTVEGPIGDDITFMISGRRMYLDLMMKMVTSDDEEVPNYYFYDLNAKANYKISESDRIFVSGFFGRDLLSSPESEDNNFEMFWGNKTGNLRWMHIVSPTVFTNFSLIYTDYNFNTVMTDDNRKQRLDIFSGIRDLTLRADAQYFPNDKHIIKTGIETTWHHFRASAEAKLFGEEWEDAPENIINTIDAAIFAQDEWQITPVFNANIGMRLYYFENGNYLNAEPRISGKYNLSDLFSINASFAVANQYLHLLVRNDITLPTDLWFPSTKSVIPSRSIQGSLGFEYQLFDREYLLTGEIYYKNMSNIYEYKDDADFNFGVPLEEQFVKGRGRAYGLELFLNKRLGQFAGWIGYTLAWTERQFDELNDGKWFSPRYDRRHDISIVVTWKPSERWELSCSWVYGTGQAYTMPTGSYNFPTFDGLSPWYEDKYQYTDRNGFRLPPYHRFDFNAIHHFEWFGLPFQFYISIYNLYNRHNPFAWYIDYDYVGVGDEWKEKKTLKQISLFPIIPTFGLNFSF